MTNLPPMSGRAFRDYFMIEDREGEGGNLNPPKRKAYVFDPDDEMIPEQSCDVCCVWIDRGDMVVPSRQHRVIHQDCVEESSE